MADSPKQEKITAAAQNCCLQFKQQRARVTRAELIRAARAVFAQDGFEQARIEDIAAKAGKTRGAFYANFSDKEDVFFAIFEEDLSRDHMRVQPMLQAAGTTEERIDAITDDLMTLLTDRQRSLLTIEFKMYAIRRPHKQKRLAELHAAMLEHFCMTKIDHFMPEMAHVSSAERRESIAAIGALLDGTSLNRLFDPTALTVEQLKTSLRCGVSEVVYRYVERSDGKRDVR